MPIYNISDASISTGTSAKTHLQLVAPATRRLQVTRLVVSLHGVTSSEVPGGVDLVVQTTAGTASSATPVPSDSAETASLSTGCQKGFSGAEPTYTDYKYRARLTPNGGFIDVPLEDLGIYVTAGTRLGLVLTYAVSTTATTQLFFRE